MNILVTGGSSGLGRATVIECTEIPGSNIIFTYCRKKDEAFSLEKQFNNVKAIYIDFTKDESVKDFLELLPGLNIDVLVNNAYVGNPQGTHFHKTPVSDFEKAFKENVLPTLQITQKCLDGMRKRKFGKIVNVLTSYLIDLPPTGFSVYTSIKETLRQISKCINAEYKKFNITSNCVLPDFMNTEFGKVEEFQLEMLRESNPLKKILSPEEVAKVISFLIMSSQHVNGVEIPVNAAQHIF